MNWLRATPSYIYLFSAYAGLRPGRELPLHLLSFNTKERRPNFAFAHPGNLRSWFCRAVKPGNSPLAIYAGTHYLWRKLKGATMAMSATDIERFIKEALPDALVDIRDLAGDGDHYAANVVSAAFKGKSRVQQHQMVYTALKGRMGGELHALALQTSVPAEMDP
jgi:stress-induced morphogen